MSPDALIIISAFMLGLVGSLHCIGMCGGIAGMLHAASSTAGPDQSLGAQWRMTLAYNGGRIASYMLAGGLAALLGVSLMGLIGKDSGRALAQVVSGLFMILLGLYLTGWWNALAPVEKLGMRLWRRISPLTRHFLPINSYGRALAAGAIWGWLPCGLVYSALAMVLMTGKPLTAMAAMGAFGFGTLPVVSAVGMLSGENGLMRRPVVRKIAGSLVMLFGVAMFTGIGISHGSH